jgi:hypothetical protein
MPERTCAHALRVYDDGSGPVGPPNQMSTPSAVGCRLAAASYFASCLAAPAALRPLPLERVSEVDVDLDRVRAGVGLP